MGLRTDLQRLNNREGYHYGELSRRIQKIDSTSFHPYRANNPLKVRLWNSYTNLPAVLAEALSDSGQITIRIRNLFAAIVNALDEDHPFIANSWANSSGISGAWGFSGQIHILLDGFSQIEFTDTEVRLVKTAVQWVGSYDDQKDPFSMYLRMSSLMMMLDAVFVRLVSRWKDSSSLVPEFTSFIAKLHSGWSEEATIEDFWCIYKPIFAHQLLVAGVANAS